MCLFFVFLLTRAKAVYVCLSSSFRELGGLEIIFLISTIQLVVYYQYCILIGLATTRLYVIAH